MAYFVALDGGGTKTECWVANESRVLGQASGPTVKIMNVGEQAATENLRTIVREALGAAGVAGRLDRLHVLRARRLVERRGAALGGDDAA